MGISRQAAAPKVARPTPKEMAKTLSTSMPTSRAPMRSLATARIALPVSVRVMNRPSRPHSTMAATKETTLGTPSSSGPSSIILSL